jgi:prophage antirepressor-like protein
MDMNMDPNAQAPALQTFSGTVEDRSVELTAVTIDSVTWFRGADVAASLGYKELRHAIRTHVDDEDKVTLENLRGIEPATLNQYEKAQVFISESGFYSLILSSKMPIAKAFKKWVTSKVLPAIQKTGAYVGHPSGCCEPIPPAISQAQTEVEIQNSRLARLQAIKAAKEVADKFGFLISDDHQEHARMAVNEVLLPIGWEQRDMIDATEYLRRRGHTETETRHISSEFGRALKTAQEKVVGSASIANLQGHGPRNIPNCVCMYNAKAGAAFLDAVYETFKGRQLYQKHVQENPLKRQIEAALQDARGFGSQKKCKTRSNMENDSSNRAHM